MGQMVAQKQGIGDLNERIIHLEIEEMTNALFVEPLEQAGFLERRQCAAVAIGAEKQSARCVHQELSGFQIKGRHGSLLKERNLLRSQAKIGLLFK